MSVNPLPKSHGAPRAEVTCDECGRAETVTADYERKASGRWEVNTGQVIRKITGQNWTEVKGSIYCPTCTAKRKAFKMKEPKPASNVADIRKPDGKQMRLIIMALEDAYDDVKKCYRGQETDKTVAEGIGGGVMPGWVTAIREDMFGPAGNEEVMEILGQIGTLSAALDDFRAKMLGQLGELRKRVDTAVSKHDRRTG